MNNIDKRNSIHTFTYKKQKYMSQISRYNVDIQQKRTYGWAKYFGVHLSNDL